jgi:hypothetical protein
MFKRKYTKWLPILIYDFSGNRFLLQGRQNIKTGELHFKNRRMNTAFNLMQSMPVDIFNPKEQFDILLTQPKNPE